MRPIQGMTALGAALLSLAVPTGAVLGAAAEPVVGERATLTMIVDRSDGDMVYYLLMPAEQIVPLLNTDPELVFSANGAVPIDAFRREGSFDLADDVFRGVRSNRPDGALAFYSMSLMLHPKGEPMPFDTPFDGLTAISVCTVDYAFDAFVPGDLDLYYGAYAYEVADDETVTLTFPETGRAALDVVIRQYVDGRFVTEETAVLEDGGTLALAPAAQSAMPMPPAALAFAGITVLLLGAWRIRVQVRA
ncbi:MAG: hypothetical protein AAF565_12320 [Pseudomonadota bacterium]